MGNTTIFVIWYLTGLVSILAFIYHVDKKITIGVLIESLLFALAGFLATLICIIELIKDAIRPLNIKQKVKQIWNKRII